MSGNSTLIKAAAVLLLLWGAVWGISKFVSGLRPSPEKAIAYLDKNDLSGIDDPDQRKQVLGDLADMLNAMEPDEVQEFQKTMFGDEPGDDAGGRQFFETLSQEEQWYFMERRIGRAFDQMMMAFNEMDRDERKKIVEQTLRRMRDEDSGDRQALDRLEGQDREMVEKITTEGFRAYFEQASAATKMDLAPVVEQMQKNIGGGRGPR